MLRRIAIVIVPVLLTAFHAAAQDLQKGEAAYERGDYATAFKEFQPLAKKGSARAQYLLGTMYEYGWGVRRNYSQAAKWHRKAASRGNADAKVNLQFLYLMGRAKPPKRSSRLGMRAGPLKEALPKSVASPSTVFKVSPTAFHGQFGIQLGALKTKARAISEAARLSRVHRSLLGAKKIALVRADLGRRGVFYRLRVGPLPVRAARALCRNLSASREGCIVVKL